MTTPSGPICTFNAQAPCPMCYPAAAATALRVGGYATIPGVNYEQGEQRQIPERDDDTPILAYKTAALRWQIADETHPSGLRLRSVFTSADYDDSDRAVCSRYPRTVTTRNGNGTIITTFEDHDPPEGHDAPQLECSCGFYAVRDRDRALSNWHDPGQVLIEVELFGRVIVFEKGYRAERQRLLRVAFPGCWYCQGASTHLVGIAPQPWESWNGPPESILTPICTACMPLAKEATLAYSFDDVGARFGCTAGYEAALTLPARTMNVYGS